MYTGFNARKQRKLTKIESLRAENEKLRKTLTTMIHIHERLKHERTQMAEAEKLPPLPKGTVPDSGAVGDAHSDLSQGSGGEPEVGKDQKGA